MTKNRLTPSEQAKIDFVNRCARHRIMRTGNFKKYFEREMAKFEEELKEEWRERARKRKGFATSKEPA